MSICGPSAELQALDAQVPNKLDWRYEMRREAQEILPGEPAGHPLPSPAFAPLPSAISCTVPSRQTTRVDGVRAGLFVGPFQPSWKLDVLQGMGITHVLCIADPREACVCSCLALNSDAWLDADAAWIRRQPPLQTPLPGALCLPHSGHPRRRRPEPHSHLPPVRPLFLVLVTPHTHLDELDRRAQTFIDSALSAGGRVYVHCGDGISRSPAIVCVAPLLVLSRAATSSLTRGRSTSQHCVRHDQDGPDPRRRVRVRPVAAVLRRAAHRVRAPARGALLLPLHGQTND